VMVLLGGFLPTLMQRIFSITGMIAAGNITRRPKRALSTTLLLTYGLTMGVFIGESNFGYTDFVRDWNEGENLGDLTVVGAGTNPFNPLIGVPSNVVEAIRARGDVAAVITESSATLRHEGREYNIRAVDLEAFIAQGGRFAWNTGDEATAYQRLLDQQHPALLVNAGFAVISSGLSPGSLITLPTPNGDVTFEVVGVILGGVMPDRISIVMDQALYSRLWHDSQVDRLQVILHPQADVQEVRRELLREYADQGVVTLDSREMMAAFSNRMTSISTVSSLLSSLFAVIMLAGIGSTLYVMVLDRRREIGMLRAVGMLRSQITRSMMMEGLIMLGIAIIVGLPSAVFGNLMQQMAMQVLMGIGFSLNPVETAFVVLLSAALIFLATYLPAQFAGRTNVLEAMRYE
jgi:putative ABC transport system permease protein